MIDGLLRSLGLDPNAFRDGELAVHTPIDGSRLAAVRLEGRAAVAAKVERAEQAFRAWRQVPAPRRGELVRLFGEELRRHKAELGELVSWEAGKITQEGLGEVQEMIDICDFAVASRASCTVLPSHPSVPATTCARPGTRWAW